MLILSLLLSLLSLLSIVVAVPANPNFTPNKRDFTPPWESLDNELLCPEGNIACPIAPRMTSYECLQPENELSSCGGCVSRGEGQDCTQIKGTVATTCSYGRCKIVCDKRYQLVTNVYGIPSCVHKKRKMMKD